jgi:hypothetical protein
MTLTVSLSPEEEAKLFERAQAQGVSPEVLVHDAVRLLLADPVSPEEGSEPKLSMYGFLKDYGRGPSEEDIDENRREMFANFGREDIV